MPSRWRNAQPELWRWACAKGTCNAIKVRACRWSRRLMMTPSCRKSAGAGAGGARLPEPMGHLLSGSVAGCEGWGCGTVLPVLPQ